MELANTLCAGETAATLTGQYSDNMNNPLTDAGVAQISSASERLVGPGKLIDPAYLKGVWCAPSHCAIQTLALLLDFKESSEAINLRMKALKRRGLSFILKDHVVAVSRQECWKGLERVRTVYSKDMAEWNFGRYEGTMLEEIRGKEENLTKQRDWNIWEDGCKGVE